MSDSWIGLDIGTQGVRGTAIDCDGKVLASASISFGFPITDAIRQEQDPWMWWRCIGDCLGELGRQHDLNQAVALSLVATSGTLVLADRQLQPLGPAIMWNDKRSTSQAEHCNELADGNGGVTFRPTFTLPKAIWIKENQPALWDEAAFLLSAGDWLLARIVEGEPWTDYTNALKTGADLRNIAWPDWVKSLLPAQMLPQIVVAGTLLGTVSQTVARDWGLPTGLQVVTGVTDANGGQIAAGIVTIPGSVTTIGTGTSIKTVSEYPLNGQGGYLYSHRQWDGNWTPSATSHCGAGVISTWLPGSDLNALTAQRPLEQPANVLVLPLANQGEYFPFWAPFARSFQVGSPDDDADLLRGCFEGVAFVERLALERMESAGALPGSCQVTLGGGSRNETWMRVRASVLGRPVTAPVCPAPSYGAALIALGGLDGALTQTIIRTVRYTRPVEPDASLQRYYDSRYGEFLRQLRERGYLTKSEKTQVVPA